MKKIGIFIIAVIIYAASTAQQTPPQGGSPKGFTLPAQEVITLDNGLEIVLVPWGSIPKVTLQMVVKTGNIHEAENEVWLSDLTGEMMKEGSDSLSSEQIANAMAGMGGNLNIGVGPHTTNISSSVLYEFAPDAIKIMADVLTAPAFPASEIERLKNDFKRNLNIAMSQAQSVAKAEFFAALYPDHPYGRVFPTEAMIDAYSLEMVKAFYAKNFGAKRTRLYVSGMFDKQAVVDAATEALSTWREGPEDQYPIAVPNTSAGLKFSDRPGVPQSTLLIGIPVADASSEDYIPFSVMNSLLGGSFGSRITRNIREDKGYTYSPHSVVDYNYKSAIWYEDADVTTADTKASIQEIAKEIRTLQNEAPGKEELDGIQNYMAGIFVLQNGTPSGIINQLVFLDIHNLPYEVLQNKVQDIYDVSPEKIQEMAKKYIRLDDMFVMIVGDGEKVQPQIKDDNPLNLLPE